MTYKECYMQFENIEDLIKEVKNDLAYAILINRDRIITIRKVVDEVLNEKYKDISDQELRDINLRLKGGE